MLELQSARRRTRPLLACNACGQCVSLRAVDDVAAAAIRDGWRVVATDASGARWQCPECVQHEQVPLRHDERPRP